MDVLLPVITDIVNLSFESGVFLDKMKHAMVEPLLKKSGLDPNLLKIFGPISNLTYLSKIIERVVASRLSTHMNENNLAEPMLSAYRLGHSTETALLHVHNNILRAVDEPKAVALVLLDLSAAFDKIDHNFILSRLSKRFGVGGISLKYINETLSSPVDVLYGVPQGSVLGLKLFTIYTLPIADIVRKFNLEIHLYADLHYL